MNSAILLLVVGLGVASICQALTGIGFSLVASPVLILVLGHTVGLQLVISLGLIVSTVLVVSGWRHLSARELTAIFVPAAMTAPSWLWVIGTLSEDVVARAAGTAAVLAVTVTALRWRPRVLRGRLGAIVSGGLSSGLVVAGGVGGPPLIMYAASNGWPPAATRATLNAYFTLFGIVMVALIGLPPADGATGAATVGMLAGLAASTWLAARLSASIVMRGTLVLAGVSGLMLVILGG